MVDFRSQWQGHLAILELLWTLYTPQIKSINRNTCLRIVDVRGIMACACACAKGRLEIRQKIYTNGFSG